MKWTSACSSSADSRIRLKSSDIMNLVEERIEFLRMTSEEEARRLDNLQGAIHRYIREKIDEEHADKCESELRKIWRARVEEFIQFCIKEKREITPAIRESIVDIFLSLAHSKMIMELDDSITQLTKEINEAKSVFTPRQALEEVVKGAYDRNNRFSTLLMDDRRLQDIFNRKFNGYVWNKKTISHNTPLPFKAEMARKLYAECYEVASAREIHFRAAPQSGVVVNSANYRRLQIVFLDVVATYLNKNAVFI